MFKYSDILRISHASGVKTYRRLSSKHQTPAHQSGNFSYLLVGKEPENSAQTKLALIKV